MDLTFSNIAEMLAPIVQGYFTGLHSFLACLGLLAESAFKQSNAGVQYTNTTLRLWKYIGLQALGIVTADLIFRYTFLPANKMFHRKLIGNSNMIDNYSIWINGVYIVFCAIPALVSSRVFGTKVAKLMFQNVWQATQKGLSPKTGPLLDTIVSTIALGSTYGLVAVLQLVVGFRLATLACYALLSVVYSFYAFDYAWVAFGLPFEKRRELVEQHWPYFLGFSSLFVFTMAMCTFNFISGSVAFVTLFPILVMAATMASQSPVYESTKVPFKLFLTMPGALLASTVVRIARFPLQGLVSKYEPQAQEDTGSTGGNQPSAPAEEHQHEN